MGYTTGHFQGKLAAPSPNLYIRVKAKSDRPPNAGVLTRIQIFTPGMVPTLPLYRPANNVRNEIAATIHRYGRDMPVGDDGELRHLLEYVKQFLIEFVIPLKDTDVKSVKVWIDECNQTGHRKDYFRRIRSELENESMKNLCAVESFIKSEGYIPGKEGDEVYFSKFPRAINSYSDLSKVVLGPIISACDKALFKSPWLSKFFVKYSDPRTWVSRVKAMFGDLPVYSSDFKSFESHHRGALARVTYMWLMHSIRHLTGVRPMRDMIARMVLGRNYIRFGGIDVELNQTLMSGALWTSSANGFLNLVLNSYMSAKTVVGDDVGDMLRYVKTSFRGLFEGDDGIVEDVKIPRDLVTRLGLNLEVTPHPHCSVAGFCSMYFSMESDQLIREPFEFMRKFCSMSARYSHLKDSKKMSLMRVKTKSHLDTLAHCPIIGEFLANVDKFTAPYDLAFGESCLDSHEMEKYRWAKQRFTREKCNVNIESRMAMERQFGIRVDVQLCLEAQIRVTRGQSFFCIEHDNTCPDDLYYVENFYANDSAWLPLS